MGASGRATRVSRETSDKARSAKQSKTSDQRTTSVRRTAANQKRWESATAVEYKPPRKISDKELEAARKMFFDLDRDGSGSIDAEELGMMLRSLGQNPTDEELKELIDSVDEGDKDGQIQLREFLKLYTQSLDAKKSGAAGKDDINNVFCALGGDPRDEKSVVDIATVKQILMDHYGLEVESELIGKGDSCGVADIEQLLVESK